MSQYMIHHHMVEQLQRESVDKLNNPEKIRGAKKHNKFSRTSKETKRQLNILVNTMLQTQLFWNFDFFHSGEPVGLHTDYDVVPWDEKEESIVTTGIIIPIGWTCKQPYTLIYDHFEPSPNKLMYNNGAMRTADGTKMDPERADWYDYEVERHNPKGTMHHKELNGIKIIEEYEWKIGTAFVFDTRYWHSSSWFLPTPDIEDDSSVFKRMVVGFGSVDVQRY